MDNEKITLNDDEYEKLKSLFNSLNDYQARGLVHEYFGKKVANEKSRNSKQLIKELEEDLYNRIKSYYDNNPCFQVVGKTKHKIRVSKINDSYSIIEEYSGIYNPKFIKNNIYEIKNTLVEHYKYKG